MTQQNPVRRTGSGQSSSETGALVQALCRGDARALGEVYVLYRKAVHTVLCRKLGCPSAADDLTQEAFLLLPQAIQTFRGGCSLKTFVVSIAVNLGRHHLRTSSRRRRVLAGFAAAPQLALVPSPEQLLGRQQLGQAIAGALSQLSEDKQKTFLLREYHQYSSLETAQMTHAPEATVRTRVHHARRMLRDVLEREGYESAA